jgi:hypothetical protein
MDESEPEDNGGHGDGKTALTAIDLERYEFLCRLVEALGRGYVQTKITEDGAMLFEVRITVIPPSRKMAT